MVVAGDDSPFDEADEGAVTPARAAESTRMLTCCSSEVTSAGPFALLLVPAGYASTFEEAEEDADSPNAGADAAPGPPLSLPPRSMEVRCEGFRGAGAFDDADPASSAFSVDGTGRELP